MTTDKKCGKGKPNFLIIMVDEQRFPPPYETEEIKKWREKYLKAQNLLKKTGVEFKNHYAGSTACSPSRATLYTGQYPSLHGVTQTDAGGASAFSGQTFWLDPNTVPTFGDYLRTAGYDTFWKGKWHASHPDIIIPATHNSYISYNPQTGVPIPENVDIYLKANRLGDYGFDGWVGPEPHGSSPRNSGSSASQGVSGRDEFYSAEVIELLNSLSQKESLKGNEAKPWAIVASFVNPHDIALYGEVSRLLPMFNFDIDSSVPEVPPAPTAHESLDTKPRVQASYRVTYQKMVQPLLDTETYRRLYYSLQLHVDREIWKVLEALRRSNMYEDTIIIYTSDHGDLLGSHGGLFQKWYNAYEESIHVPLIISSPKLCAEGKSVDLLTSHVDILPTILGLADIDVCHAMSVLKKDHTEVHPLVGRDLSSLLTDKDSELNDEPVYFMTDDDPSKTFKTGFLGMPLEPVTQPSHIETVVVKLPTGPNKELEIWKYSRYFDNPQFWTDPGTEDEQTTEQCSVEKNSTEFGLCVTTVKTNPVPDEIEMYNLTKDPIEAKNLANPQFSTPESRLVEQVLAKVLFEQCKKKRLYPSTGSVEGKPDCVKGDPVVINL